MTSVGFTGSRDGGIPSMAQIVAAEQLLFHLRPDEVHHGDCVGSDHWFHLWATGPRKHKPTIIIHPPDNPKFRAFCMDGATVLPPKPYIKRNHDIVNASDILVATPHGTEEVRSGTWATIRYARKKGIPIYIIYPNGNVVTEGESIVSSDNAP